MSIKGMKMVDTRQLTTATTRSKKANSKITLDVNHLTRNTIYHENGIRGSRNKVKETIHLPITYKQREPGRTLVNTVFQPTGSYR